MYGYNEHIDITPEQILQKVDQIKIFELVLKLPVVIGNRYYSPFREDKIPKCFFTQREDGIILFVDFGDRKRTTHRSCFKMIMDSYEPSLNLSQAIEVICEHFSISKNSTDYKPVGEFPKPQTIKNRTSILYTPKPYESKDKRYWNSFITSIDNLEEDGVFSVKKFTIINNKGIFTKHPISLCYAIDFLIHVKLYMPHDSLRFISNCDENDIGNVNNLSSTGDYLIVTKSYKDHRVIRNALNVKDVIWLMNEGCVPDEYILLNLLSRFTTIILFFDNDIPGFKAAYKLSNILNSLSPQSNIKIRYIPIKYNYKDAGELVKREGRQDTVKLLNNILWH